MSRTINYIFGMHKSLTTLLIISFFSCSVYSQDIKQEYINQYKEDAVKKMLDYGIPASIILSQAILESSAGKSNLAKNANNHFGIKCHTTWSGPTFIMNDDYPNECFRKYKTVSQSYDDYALFLTNRDRYAFLFEIPITDYEAWAHGLKRAGYAANPQYAFMLIKIIKDYKLNHLDNLSRIDELRHEEKKETHIVASTKYPEYLFGDTEDFHPVSVSATNRVIYKSNGVEYVLALQQDSWEVIAEEFDLFTKQILDFNSANRKIALQSGDRVYIEKKNRKASVMYHIVQYGETLQMISQKYAVRSRSIQKRNGIKSNESLIAGQRLKLR